MIVEVLLIVFGLVASFFLKDFNFLALEFDFFNTGIVYPDFLLMFVIFFALHKGEFSGLWIGFFAGILEDSGIISFAQSGQEFSAILGIHSLVYSLFGFALGKLNRFVDRNSIFPVFVIVLFGSILVRFLIWLVMGIVNDFNQSYSFFGPAIYTAIVSPLWFFLLLWMYRSILEDEK